MIFASQSKKKVLPKFKPSEQLKNAYPPGTLLAQTKTGSASRETLDQLLNNIVAFYGDVEDKDGKRIVIKLDGGPALPKNDPDWLEKQRNRGIVIFPGLPNGSGVNQVRHGSLRSMQDM